ncbi:MAG TPA: hypothetical protein PKE05_10205 [Microthrixaceae bacterium]|nr:hypothetical protein [Microthrixaceae bacterium]
MVRSAAGALLDRVRRTLVWGVWERMLETEFVDRSVALAGKAFVSFFPLAIVVAAFMPPSVRSAMLAAITSRLGLRGDALALTGQAFVSADDLRRATGVLGLVMTFFFARSFTTALQRVYLRAWRRPRNLKGGSYTRGLAWLAALLVFMTITGALGEALGDGIGLGVLILLTATATTAWWWFSAWYLLLGDVRWRVLLPTAVISTITLLGFALTAALWMPYTVTRNLNQFGVFGIALALVTWFSGASLCLIVGACAGAVLAQDPGPIGRLVRGDRTELLTGGAPPSLDAPSRTARLRDAFNRTEDDAPGGGRAAAPKSVGPATRIPQFPVGFAWVTRRTITSALVTMTQIGISIPVSGNVV